MKETVKTSRTSPAQFIREVRQEIHKIAWPKRPEILASGMMVFILSALAAVFFLLVDSVISTAIRWVLGSS